MSVRGSDSEKLTNVLIGHSGECSSFTNIENERLGEFGKSICLSNKVNVSVSAFVGHVLHVFLLRSKEQMSRIYARWVVAFMQHFHAFWNCSIMQNPRSSVTPYKNTKRAGNLTVVVKCSGTSPNPTLTEFNIAWKWSILVYLFPKSVRKVLRKMLFGYSGADNFILHKQIVCLCHALGCWFTARAFSLSQIGGMETI